MALVLVLVLVEVCTRTFMTRCKPFDEVVETNPAFGPDPLKEALGEPRSAGGS